MSEKRETKQKILGLEELEKFREENSDKKIVFTVGCFDIIHKGHIFFLNQCAQIGDLLVVGLAADSTVKLLKGSNRPINSEANRLHLIASLQDVDYAILHPDMVATGRREEYLTTKIDFKEILEKLRPDYFALGYDTVSAENKIKMCKELGVNLHVISQSVNEEDKPISSTGIIEKARKN
ncbi:adenylyltransferase/cytidyltransferase family protein [Candidatus Pacearchaeota archaeon]|nr:adenylyltransferase/cytidyltransferase family protein [Candidatus Pacearchaeota archaeon]